MKIIRDPPLAAVHGMPAWSTGCAPHGPGTRARSLPRCRRCSPPAGLCGLLGLSSWPAARSSSGAEACAAPFAAAVTAEREAPRPAAGATLVVLRVRALGPGLVLEVGRAVPVVPPWTHTCNGIQGGTAPASSWPENVGVCLVELAGLISVWQCPTALVSVVGVMPGLTPLIIRRLCSARLSFGRGLHGKRCPGPAVHGE